MPLRQPAAHVGTARTALYSYLFARRNGGQFVLRIEDTDTERNVADSAAGIVDGLRWLGLDWDEGYLKGGPHGPYVQTERLDRYHAAVNALVAHGDAYLCYCTNEELEQRRQAAQAAGLPPGYDGHCRHLRPDQVRAYEAEGRRPAVRFRLPDEGETVVEDLIRGRVGFDNATLHDFVILRANGIPTYHFSATYDDVDMSISHVIRGEDLFPSTPLHVHVFQALGQAAPPAFAHLPLIVGADRRKLSKRRDRMSVEQFRAARATCTRPSWSTTWPCSAGRWTTTPSCSPWPTWSGSSRWSGCRATRPPSTTRSSTPSTATTSASSRRPTSPPGPGCSSRRPPSPRPTWTCWQGGPLLQERVNHLTEVPGMVGFLFTDEVELDAAAAAKVLTDRAKASWPRRPSGSRRSSRGPPMTSRDPSRPPDRARPQAQDGLPAGPPGHHRPAGQPAAVRVHGAARQALLARLGGPPHFRLRHPPAAAKMPEPVGPRPAIPGVWGNWQPDGFWPR